MEQKDEYELIEIKSITSPRSSIHAKLKNRNKVGSSSSSSPSRDFLSTKLPPLKPPRLSLRKKSIDTTESSKSDIKSYKERLKERFENIKSKASTKPHKRLDLEQNKVDEHLKKYTRGEVQKEWEVSQIERYHFFCFEEKENTNQVEPEGTHNDSEINQSTDILYNGPEMNNLLIETYKPEDSRYILKISSDESLWYPSSSNINLTEKIGEDRAIQDAGIVSIETPKVPRRYLNKIEHRLLIDKKWFNGEGQLKILPNPYSKNSFRPIEPQIKIDTEFQSPIPYDDQLEQIIVNREHILDLYINNVQFKHHPLFSLEHVLQQRLSELFGCYKQNKQELLEKRLEALRKMKNNLLKTAEVNEEKLKEVIAEMGKLREMVFQEGALNRKNLKEVLSTWRMIKNLRRENGYSNTAIRMIIRKEKCHYQEEKQDRDGLIEKIVDEIIEEKEIEFRMKMKDYKMKLQEWKNYISKEESQENLPKKPKKPIKDIDKDIIMHEIEEHMEKSYKPPGEPILNFDITYDNPVSTLGAIENSKEKLRRNSVNCIKIYMKIICNNITVCKSKTVNLNDNFNCIFDEAVSIQTTKIPEKITIEIHQYEKNTIQDKVTTVNLKVPSPRDVHLGKNMEENFRNEEVISYKHEGCGSGFKMDNSEDFLYTNGIITCSMEWSSSSFENSEEIGEISVVNEDGTINVEKLIHWATIKKPDPRDPRNSILYDYMKKFIENPNHATQSKKSFFRRNPDMDRLEFCDFKELEENPRFQLLKLRDENESEFVGMVVPNRLKEIPINLLSDYKKRLKNQEDESNSEEDTIDEEIDSKRSKGRRLLKTIYSKIFQLCQSAENNLEYEDVVDEKRIQYIQNTLRFFLSQIIEAIQFNVIARPLSKISRKKMHFQRADFNSTFSVILHLVSASNVPQRNDNLDLLKTPQSSKNRGSMEPKPFVELHYLKESIKSSVAQTSNPVWNEDLILPLDSTISNYLSPNALNGSIKLHLFDEISPQSDINPNGEKNWLGSIEIPISAIYDKMEGTFKVVKPTILFGYEHDLLTGSIRTNMSLIPTIQNTYLTFSVQLEPKIPKLTPSMDEYESNELPQTLKHILRWNENFNCNHPLRKCSVLVLDSYRKSICITRYFKALEPPQLNPEGFEVTPEQCLKYVSLIPFTNSNKFYQNVCLTTEQLLKFMVGSVVDHAVALTCYFLALDLEAWLLYGKGIPNGLGAYVLVREYHEGSQIPLHFIYDPVSASKHNISDVSCPVTNIFYVANATNVWGNIQRTPNVFQTNFDFTRRGDWLPLFDNNCTAPTNSVQQKLTYLPNPDVEMLEKRIEKQIRKTFTKLRKYSSTFWNPYLSATMRTILPKLGSIKHQSRAVGDLFKQLQEYGFGNSINGFVLTVPYVNVKQVVAEVVATGIHLRVGAKSEFALGIKIFAYPNHVFAVWIALALIGNRTQDSNSYTVEK